MVGKLLKAQLAMFWISPLVCWVFAPTTAADEKRNPSQPYVFKSREEAERVMKQRELQNQTNILERMRAQGAFPEQINAEKEGFQLMNAGVSVRTWKTWTNRYRAKLVVPPAVFDVTEPSPVDFSNPVAALRSYFRAIQIGDARTLLSHSDQSGRAWLKRQLRVDENVPRTTYQVFPKLSHYTVLLTAENTFKGKDYVLVLFRAQERTDPRQGRVALDVCIFRREGDGLLITRDLDFTSPFGDVRGAARVQPTFLSPYPKFYEAMRQSDFPPYFYTIEDGS